MSKFSHVTAWLFDLDDTLYAPETGFSKHMSKVQHQALAGQLNIDMKQVKPYLLALVEKHGGAPFTGLFKENAIDMDLFIEEGFKLDHGMLSECAETVSSLNKLHGGKFIFTNSPKVHAENVLKALGLSGVFDIQSIFDVTRLDYDSKPLKSSFEKVLIEIGEPGESCAMIEDSLPNLKMAKSFGMTTVWVHGEGDKPDYVDYAYTDILTFLKDAAKLS